MTNCIVELLMQPTYTPIAIDGCYRLDASHFVDKRGSFGRLYTPSWLPADFSIVQSNYSLNPLTSTFRGFHGTSDNSETKIIYLISGSITGCIFSKTSKSYLEYNLSVDTSPVGVLLAPDTLHAFLTRKPNTNLVYMTNSIFNPATYVKYSYLSPSFSISESVLNSIVHISDTDRLAPFFSHDQ